MLLLSILLILLAVLALPIKLLDDISRFNTHPSVILLYNIDGPLSLLMVIPAPSACERLLEPLANKIVLSLISTMFESIIV